MKSTETRNESMIEKKVEEMVYEKVIQPFCDIVYAKKFVYYR